LIIDRGAWRAASKREATARRFLAREAREIRWTAALSDRLIAWPPPEYSIASV
jgi:hypothetical protein